jgi:tetratricopeptide (TPR) repeat protein
VSLTALIHTLCDFIPLETIIDREYLETLVSSFSMQYEQLQASTTLPREILLRQQDVFRQQCSHLGHVEETLHHRRRHRAAWLSPSLVAVAAAAISADRMASMTPQESAMGGMLTNMLSSHRLTRNHLRRTLFSQESWLQAASTISPEVLTAATELWQQPDDVNTANWLFRLLVDEAYGAEGHEADKLERTFVSTEIYMENRLPIRTLALELPEAGSKSAVAQFLAGHDFALVRKHQEAVDAYLNAFLLSPDEPLIALTLSGYFLLLSSHPLFKARYDNLLRAMCFLVHYQKQRRLKPMASDGRSSSTPESIRSEVTLYQETLYNLAKLFHDLKLHHLAVANYRKVLQLYDDYLAPPRNASEVIVAGVTREAAHNLVLLYRLSQSKALALSIMMKYLRFE